MNIIYELLVFLCRVPLFPKKKMFIVNQQSFFFNFNQKMANCYTIPIMPSAHNADAPSLSPAVFIRDGCDANSHWINWMAPDSVPLDNVPARFPGFSYINSAVVPVNTKITGCDQPNFKGNCRELGKGHYPGGLAMPIVSFDVDSVVPHKKWLRKCCLGEHSPSSDCLNYSPGTTDCEVLLKQMCSDRNEFFSPECKTYMQNFNSAAKNQIASQVCKEATTPEEKDWCACFNLGDIPPHLAGNPSIAALWPCLNQTCNSSALSLQPFAKNCPNELTICSNSDIVQTLQQSEIGSSKVQNLCGNINLPPAPGTPPPTPLPTPTPAPSLLPAALSGLSNTTFALIILGLLLVVAIPFILIIRRMRKKDTVTKKKKK